MAPSPRQGKTGRTWLKHSIVPARALQQSSLHDALLHPALRLRPQNPLYTAAYFLHRSSDLRAAYSHVRVRGDYADCRRHHGLDSHRSRLARGMDYWPSLDDFRSPDFLVDPPRLSAKLVFQHLQIFRRRIYLSHRSLRRARSHFPDHAGVAMKKGAKRSEEHTSELKSPCNLVCRL